MPVSEDKASAMPNEMGWTLVLRRGGIFVLFDHYGRGRDVHAQLQAEFGWSRPAILRPSIDRRHGGASPFWACDRPLWPRRSSCGGDGHDAAIAAFALANGSGCKAGLWAVSGCVGIDQSTAGTARCGELRKSRDWRWA